MLSELKKIIDTESVELADMKQTASVLLERQFLYADQSRDKKHYQRVINHITYFSKLFAALNRRIVYDHEFGYAGSMPEDGTKVVQLPNEDAILLLCLRLIYEEGIEKFDVKQGSVFTDSETLLNRYVALARRERPILGKLRETLKSFGRFGLIEVEAENDRTIPIQIRPTVRLVTTEAYIAQLEDFLQGRAQPEAETLGTEAVDEEVE
ncbi:MAG: DUF4194 domain-containing protein [Desulfuromonadales bacterium]